MKRLCKSKVVIITFLLIIIFLSSGIIKANKIRVPADYPNIQAGIKAANSGDTVLVGIGTYVEVLEMKSGITLLGSGSDVTIIKGGINCNNINNAFIIGFKITENIFDGIGCTSSNITIKDNLISGNVACGISSGGTSSIVIENNIIENNGLFNIHVFCTRAIVRNNIIRNSGTITNEHGAIWINGGTDVQITGNLITENKGGIGCATSSSAKISNNLIYKNGGSGIWCMESSSPTITNNTIYGNGWGIGCDESTVSSPQIINTIIWGNNWASIRSQGASQISITYSDIQGGWSGIGNINTNPLFQNIINNDFRLNVGSPCINTGNPNSIYNDLDGSRNDMGAYGGKDPFSLEQSTDEPPIEKLPIVGFAIAKPRHVITGNPVKISAYAIDAETNVSAVSAIIKDSDGNIITTLILYDDGTHGDSNSSDNIYTNTWTTTNEIKNYIVDITATDDSSNSVTYTNKASFNVTLTQPQYNIYFGNLHSHTSYSDGAGTPADAFQHARDIAKNDFLAVTDHNYGPTEQEYQDIITQANAFTQDGVFIGIAGHEWTGSLGHINIFDSPNLFDSPTSDLSSFYNELLESGCIAQFNHPSVSDFESFNYSESSDNQMALLEVQNSNLYFEAAYIYALNKGWHVGATGNQDNHTATWGDRWGWTGVLAPYLTKADILYAMMNRLTYATNDINFQLNFRSGEHWMGESFVQSGDISFNVEIFDPDAGDNLEKIELFQNDQVVATVFTNVTSFNWTPLITPITGNNYFFIKVTQADGDRIFSSPIWIECSTLKPSTPTLCSPIGSSYIVRLNPILTWGSSRNVISYTLQYSTNINFPIDETTTLTNLTDTTFTITSTLKDSTSYYWRVCANNQFGTSAYSTLGNFITSTHTMFTSDGALMQLTENSAKDYYPSVFTAANGTIWLFWTSNRDGNYEIYYKTSFDNGTNWGGDNRLTNNTSVDQFCSASQAPDGMIYLVWISNKSGNYEVYFKKFNGNIWSEEKNLSNSTLREYYTSVYVDRSGIIWVVFDVQKYSGTQSEDLYYITSSDGGENWSEKIKLSQNDNDNFASNTLQSSDGKIWIFWNTDKNGYYSIFYRVKENGIWTDEAEISNSPGGGFSPFAMQDNYGRIWLVYERGGDIIFMYKSQNFWSADAKIPLETSNNGNPMLTQINDGKLWCVFHSNKSGNYEIYALISNIPPAVTSVDLIDNNSQLPFAFFLYQNYPNPFNPTTTTIKYTIPKTQFITLKIYDILGREIRTLLQEEKLPGNYEVKFDGSGLASGIYIYRLVSEKGALSRKFVLLK